LSSQLNEGSLANGKAEKPGCDRAYHIAAVFRQNSPDLTTQKMEFNRAKCFVRSLSLCQTGDAGSVHIARGGLKLTATAVD
jgi:hypothetical protein